MNIEAKITVQEIATFLKVTPQAVHKRINNLGLKTKKIQGSLFYFDYNTSKKLIDHNVNQLKVAMAVIKGGVGKTTLTEAIAIRAALYGLKVLCIDVDQQANLTKGLKKYDEAKKCPVMIDLVDKNAGAEESILSVMPGLDLVPSRLDNVVLDGYLMVHRKNLAFLFNNIFGDIFKRYDLIIFDCPPNLHPATCSAILSSDLVITPLNPDIYSYDGLEVMDKELHNISQQFNTQINWKILLNKFDSRTVLSSSYLSKILNEEKLSSRLLKSVVRTSQEFPNIKSKEKTIFDSLRKSTAKEDIDALTKEIIEMMQKDTVKATETSPVLE